MNTIRIITAALALAAPLFTTASAQTQTQQTQTQRAVLSGSTGDLKWTLYGPGRLGNLSMNATTLQVSAHPQATVLGAKYDEGNDTAVLATRLSAPLSTVYDYHDRQLRAQGFARASQSVGEDAAQAIYTRGGERVVLRLNRQGNDVYRTTLDLSNLSADMQNGSGMMGQAQNNMAQSNMAQSNMAQGNTAQSNTAQGNMAQSNANTPIIRAPDPYGIPYLLYGPVNLGNLTSDSKMVRFSAPQGSRVTETDINENGDLMARIAGTSLSLRQVMDFYDNQFRQQGFNLINPTDTGAGLDYALTSIYERGANRVSFSVEKEFDTYRLVWDFQPPTLGNNVVRPLYGYGYGGLRYDFYGPYDLTRLPYTANIIRFGTPLDSSVTNVDRQGEDVTVMLRSNLTPTQLYNFYDAQFQRQGFRRQVDVNSSADRVQATYLRDGVPNYRLIWTAERQGTGAYKVTFNIQNTQA